MFELVCSIERAVPGNRSNPVEIERAGRLAAEEWVFPKQAAFPRMGQYADAPLGPGSDV